MADLEIGLSGLYAATKGLEVIGNNIANAATEGYHRQRLELTPARSFGEGQLQFGSGVDVAGVTRLIDRLVETEMLRQTSQIGQLDRELTTLETLEDALGEMSAEGVSLNAALDQFFSALNDLAAHPTEGIQQNQVIAEAQALAAQFNTIGQFLATLETQIQLEAQNTTETINQLSNQIATLNKSIQQTEVTGGDDNNLRDERDKLLVELAELVQIDVLERPFGVVDVSAGGVPLVMGASVMEIEAGLDDNGQLGVSIAGAQDYTQHISGGKLGGLLSLATTVVSDVQQQLDTLATAIITQVNQYHFQGVGSYGSFTELTGQAMDSEDFADLGSLVTDGTIYVRVTNTATGQVTRTAIQVDASADSMTTLAADISAVEGLNASVLSSRLRISADSGYEFDFLPAVLESPTASTLTGSAPTVSVSGIYTGQANDSWTFTVSGTGQVGNGDLQLVVTDTAGNHIATVDVGSEYAAGDLLEIDDGISISLTTGDLNDGETFSVDLYSDTDTSGVLAALGINTFFSGDGAQTIAVRSDILDDPSRVAVALGAEMADNQNILRMAALKDQTIEDLGSLTPGEYYRRLVTDVGMEVAIKDANYSSVSQMLQNLTERREGISGVDINEEAANMLLFERMFQAMARYITTVQSSFTSLMEMV